VTHVDERVASGTVLPPNLNQRYANGTFVEISREKVRALTQGRHKSFVTDMAPALGAVEE
jgi:hypothetical protein